VLVVVTACYMGTCLLALLALAWQYSLVDSVFNGTGRPDSATLDNLNSVLQTLSTATQIGIFAYIVAFLVWFSVARRAAQSFGLAGAAVLRHWTLVAWRVGIFASLAISFVLLSDAQTSVSSQDEVIEAILRADRESMIYYGVRMVVASLLIAGALVVAGRLRALTERSAAAHWTDPIYQPGYTGTPRPAYPAPSEPAGVDVGDQDGPRS
jgi:hypothetical protein